MHTPTTRHINSDETINFSSSRVSFRLIESIQAAIHNFNFSLYFAIVIELFSLLFFWYLKRKKMIHDLTRPLQCSVWKSGSTQSSKQNSLITTNLKFCPHVHVHCVRASVYFVAIATLHLSFQNAINISAIVFNRNWNKNRFRVGFEHETLESFAHNVFD